MGKSLDDSTAIIRNTRLASSAGFAVLGAAASDWSRRLTFMLPISSRYCGKSTGC
jgi:hypothetical protein